MAGMVAPGRASGRVWRPAPLGAVGPTWGGVQVCPFCRASAGTRTGGKTARGPPRQDGSRIPATEKGVRVRRRQPSAGGGATPHAGPPRRTRWGATGQGRLRRRRGRPVAAAGWAQGATGDPATAAGGCAGLHRLDEGPRRPSRWGRERALDSQLPARLARSRPSDRPAGGGPASGGPRGAGVQAPRSR